MNSTSRPRNLDSRRRQCSTLASTLILRLLAHRRNDNRFSPHALAALARKTIPTNSRRTLTLKTNVYKHLRRSTREIYHVIIKPILKCIVNITLFYQVPSSLRIGFSVESFFISKNNRFLCHKITTTDHGIDSEFYISSDQASAV